VRELQSGAASNAATLGAALVRASGLEALRLLLTSQFGPRARVLQARTALMALRALARRLAATEPALSAELDGRLERIESGAVQFVQVRAQHLVASGSARVSDAERAELARLFAAGSARARVGAPDGAADDALVAALLDGIGRWRTAAADPLADAPTVEVCDVAARTLEQLYADTVAPPHPA